MSEPKTLGEAIDQYLTWRKTNLAPSTWTRYRSVLGVFIFVVGNPDLGDFGPRHVEQFLAYHRRPHLDRRGITMPPIGPTGFNTYLTVIQTFCRWLQRHGLASIDATAGIERMTRHKPVKLRLSPDQVSELLRKSPPRERVLFSLAFFAALRASEVAHLRIQDIDLATNTLFVRVWKSNQEDEFPIGPELRTVLIEWLSFYEKSLRRTHSRGLEPADFLVPARKQHRFTTGWRIVNGKRLPNSTGVGLDPTKSVNQPWVLVKHALARIGVSSDGEGMHVLRRSAARIMFDRLIEETKYESALRIVMATLHHSTSATTEQYIGITTERRTRDQFLRSARLLDAPIVGLQTSAQQGMMPG